MSFGETILAVVVALTVLPLFTWAGVLLLIGIIRFLRWAYQAPETIIEFFRARKKLKRLFEEE